MMHSLASKLTLAFLLVGLTGAVLVAVFIRQRTRREFDQFILDQNQQALVSNLTEYYQANGSWNGLNNVFRPGREEPFPKPEAGTRWETRRSLFTVADANGTIVLAGGLEHLGQTISQSDLKKGVPLEVDDKTVGWLLFTPALDRFRPGTPEGNFLNSVNQATIFSALGAAGIALILGGILAYTLTRSLREMTAATQLLAKGELGHQVKVRSKDELGVLADSFNQMSAALARSNDLRRRMTADIAHDLRTPLSVILGYTEGLSDGKLQASAETFSVMHIEALHLSRLIDDLKILALADAGELPLARQRIAPDVLLRRASDAHRVEADRQRIGIRITVPSGLPDVEVDVERMAQILGNLMGNALRYTPPRGEITLSAERTGGGVRLRVSDNGAGIPAEDLPYIFGRSFRGDKARRQEEGETGLGLAIAKSLVEAQGGKISVESAVGEGTTFTIELPASS
ncbi:MAG: HAMP domain-containing sensor histidine kinase [Anaerolineales bacterium]|jgi:two-component system sensor histidine kinase BaeS